jgi:hypothetical protein
LRAQQKGSNYDHSKTDKEREQRTSGSHATEHQMERMRQLSESHAIATMMEKSLSDTQMVQEESSLALEREEQNKKTYQEGRWQEWRKYTKTIYIDGQQRTEEEFQYIFDSGDEISKDELEKCAVDYLNKHILIGSGYTTTDKQVTHTFNFDAPDIKTDAPRNIIVMWSGSLNNIPNGWLLCDRGAKLIFQIFY